MQSKNFTSNRSRAGSIGVALLLLVLSVVVLAESSPTVKESDRVTADAAYHEDFEKWKSELVDDLKQNWLTLAGLFWLKPGENRFGTDASNAIVLPAGSTSGHAGSFQLKGEQVTIKLAPGVAARIAGKPATSASLQPDISGEPTVVELGNLRMHVIVRNGRTGIRVKDLNSPAVQRFQGLVFYPLDLSYRVTANWVPSDGKKMVNVPNVLGDMTPTPVSGEARFTINGQEMRLTDLGGDASKGLFFVFSDPTSKTATYPGGRFLETDPVKDGTVVIDFNRAHNPPCAVTPYATCPLAPKENQLPMAITAGEKYARKATRH